MKFFNNNIMKTTKFIAIAAIAAALVSCKSTPAVDVEMPSNALTDSVSYLIGVNFGYFIKANNFAEKLNDLNMSELKKGMNDFINAKGNMGSEEFNANFKINPDSMNEVFDSYITKRNEYTAAVNKAEGAAFLEKIAGESGVVKTDSGLCYKIIEDGNDVKAGPADTVWCYYTGTLIDGTEFDKSDPEGEPVKFTLDRVIPAWTEGMQLVGEGGKIILYVPAELGYGERGAGANIKPNSTLVFDVEVKKVGKVPATEAAKE